MSAFTRSKRSNRSFPFEANKVGSASFTIGAETSNARTVSVQLKDETGQSVRVACHVPAYLSNLSTGLALAASPPQRLSAGTNGVVLPKVPSADVLLNKGTLAIHSTPEQFKTTSTALFRIGGVQLTKAATTGLTFSSAHVVTASKFGVILIQVNAAGTIGTKVPTSPQAYADAPTALAALPQPDAGNVSLGYIAIAAKAATWTANTDDMTNGSDLTTATFVDANEMNGPLEADLISNAAGQVDVVVAETGVKTFYLVLRLPNGAITVSPAIAFT